MMDGSVIEDLGGGAFSSFLGKETKINKHIYLWFFLAAKTITIGTRKELSNTGAVMFYCCTVMMHGERSCVHKRKACVKVIPFKPTRFIICKYI
jgi:hypothetical protein